MVNSTKSALSAKPSKPTPDVRLFLYTIRRWRRRSRGAPSTSDYGANRKPLLRKTSESDTYLERGEQPPSEDHEAGAHTVADLCNWFLGSEGIATGQRRNHETQLLLFVQVGAANGKHGSLDSLTPMDFRDLRMKLGLMSLSNELTDDSRVRGCAGPTYLRAAQI